jgi:maltooligosyltrehalose trehalohydrolase
MQSSSITEHTHKKPDAQRRSARVFGAEASRDGVGYHVWAPESSTVDVEIWHGGGDNLTQLAMEALGSGEFFVKDREGRAGDQYKFRLDGGDSYPDPASRAQVESVHGRSLVVDPRTYRWSGHQWSRPPFRDLVIYEVHIGTFTEEGTFRAAIEKLPYLQELGVTAMEIMPIADFPGSRNWGYDGVLIYAPARPYGTPDDLRALVDAAHQAGIAVILDVVYNHFGPDGNYVSKFSSNFFSEEHQTPWGAALNFDGPGSEFVRRFFIANPVYWMEEFHIDGFRLDATHAIVDTSEPHILAEIAEAVHARGGYVIAEDERNEAALLTPATEGGYGFDGAWADDFHHSARVGQTGQREAYFRAFNGTAAELLDVLGNGWHYRGQTSEASGEARGTECRQLPPSRFVHCISNHDQAGNRALGDRLRASTTAEGYRALSLLLCLTPYTPMIFMGQEWAASTPFLFFTDHNEQLGPLVTEGRRREFSEFPGFDDPAARAAIPDPQSEKTFTSSKLNWSEVHRGEHAGVHALHAEALKLRKADPTFRPQDRESWEVEAIGSGVVAIRYGEGRTGYLLLVNIAGENSVSLAEESFAVLGGGEIWQLAISSNDVRFGGRGALFSEAAQACDFSAAETLLLRKVSSEPPAERMLSSAADETGAGRLQL